MSPIRRLPSPLVAVTISLAIVAGCATSPIGVKRMNPDKVSRALTANALTENVPSIDSTNVLHRRGLYAEFQKKPATTLARLHRIALAEDDNDTWFALAELSFLYADRTRDRRYSVMAAIYAWSYLFGGEPPDPFDPRLRVASDLYNRGLTQGLEHKYAEGTSIADTVFELPIGTIDIEFDETSLDWNGRKLRNFIPVAELQVRGLVNRYRTPGIGAPLAASAAAADPDKGDGLLAPKLKTSVTALVRIDDVREQLRRGHIDATLELHTDPNEETVEIDGRDIPLEKEPTAVLASMVAEQPVIKQEILAFIGTVLQQQDKGRLASLRPHARGRIPIVFVHGTGSSPARWAEMVNQLDNDPEINTVYEPWFFSYNSGSPIIYSSYLLRKALNDTVRQLDPDGTDPGLQNMVVIGHSQGGLLTKMTAVHSGDLFWKNITSKPIEKVRLDAEDRALMQSVFFVEPLPFVKRVIFLCTPHRGSYRAASGWVRSIITRVVSLPATVTKASMSLLTLNPDLADLQSVQRVNAVDNMTPGNSFIKTLVAIPVDPRVEANSIIAVQCADEDYTHCNDGVVEYTSAHVEGVESEKVVRSYHSAQAVPDTISEVRRIMMEHAAGGGTAPAAAAEGSTAAPAPKQEESTATSKSS